MKINFIFALIASIFILPIATIGQSFRQINKIVASDRDTFNVFSNSVDIHGNFALIGAFREQEDKNGINTFTDAGAAYAFQYINGSWIQTQKLTPADRGAFDQFGFALALHGNYAIVGAKKDADSIGSGSSVQHGGSSYIFYKNNTGTWVEIQKIVAPDRSALCYFGNAVDIWGNTLVVGAYNAKSPGLPASTGGDGAVYIFDKDTNGVWVFAQKIPAPEPDAGDQFGYAVSLFNNQLVVGAIGESKDTSGSNNVAGAGAAYVFEKQNGTWVQVKKLVATNRIANGFFGYDVSINSVEILVASTGDELGASGQNAITNAGAVYSFSKTNNNWSFQQKIVATNRTANDRFGVAVSHNTKYAIVTSNSATDSLGLNALSYAGAGYIFKKQGMSWLQHQKIVASDRDQNDGFGGAAAINDSTILIGAPSESEDENGQNTMPGSGSAYIFKPCKNTDTTYADTSCVPYTSPSGNFIWHNSGTYFDTLRNSQGCDSILTIQLTFQSATTPIKIDTISIQRPNCFRSKDGQIQVNISGGSLPYNITWNNGDSLATISNLDTGYYQLVVVDDFGCSDSASFHITEPDSIEINLLTIDSIACYNDDDGEIVTTISGGTAPYTISWSNGDTTNNIKNLIAGNYTILVTDSSGCTVSKTFTLYQPDSLTIVPSSITPVSCHGESNGSINVLVTGGKKPYQILWSNGQTSSNINQLSKGKYEIAIVDANGCTANAEYIITEPDSLLLELVNIESAGCKNNNGSISINVLGGTEPYLIKWNTGDTGRKLTDLSSGNYSVSIIDQNLCTINETFSIEDQRDNTIFFANSFTPNSDGVNDVYLIKGDSQCYTEYWIEIYNRWGEKVFYSNTPFDNFWDGTFKGKRVPAGLYTVLFQSENTRKQFTIKVLY